jgi:hypothetical protein
MFTDKRFWFGVVTGLVGLYVYHKVVGVPGGGKKASA